MKKISWFWAAICSIIAIIAIVSWQQFGKLTPSEDILSEQEVQVIIQQRYQGEVSQIKFIDQQYQIELEKQNRFYLIKLDAEGGKVLSFVQTRSATQKPVNEPPKQLTETDAIQIALNQVNGEVDDIWLETKNNQTYYFIKIETADDREAIVQIYAITGEVMSISWDDHSEKEKDDNDD